jgi:hypothetical protein
MSYSSTKSKSAWFLGDFTIYASTLSAAREVYEKVHIPGCLDTSGIEESSSGERIGWTAMNEHLQSRLTSDHADH